MIKEVKMFQHPHYLLILAVVEGSETDYHISYNGEWFCSCLDFHYRSGFGKDDYKGDYKCKHINAVEAELGIVPEVINNELSAYEEAVADVI